MGDQKTKILVVEDDQLMANLYKKVFSFEGFEVEVAHDGEDGLEKMVSYKPNLVLLDMMMPKMNGMEVLDQVQANEELKKIPVIALSNLSGQQDIETAKGKGAQEYIIKSEKEPKEVVAIVKQVLGQS